MTQASRVLDFLWSGATNGQIAQRVGINSHQTVYMLTQQLLRRGLVRAEQDGRTWTFYALEPLETSQSSRQWTGAVTTEAGAPPSLTPLGFESLARQVMSERYGVALPPGSVSGVRKRFDFVAADGSVVGDAKSFTLVRGTDLPTAKFSVIAEHVWLLEKTNARVQFLVFGNDRAVPTLWLERHGHLATSAAFHFLTDDGRLELLQQPLSD